MRLSLCTYQLSVSVCPAVCLIAHAQLIQTCEKRNKENRILEPVLWANKGNYKVYAASDLPPGYCDVWQMEQTALLNVCAQEPTS